MNSTKRLITSVVLSVAGLIFAIITCALPNWKRVYFSTGEYIDAGLWEACGVQNTGLKVCTPYDDISNLSLNIKADRAMTIICIMLSILGLLGSFVGSNFTTFINNVDIKHKVRFGAGIVLLLAGFLLISVSWSASTLAEEVIPNLQIILGPCIYTGWVGGAFLVLAGCLLLPKWRNNSYSALQ